MDKRLLFILALGMLFLYGVYALSESDIIFPVAELGGCANEEECKIYCDGAENIEECLDFAEKYQLMPQEEIEEARKIMPLLMSGQMPGGCKEKEECDDYCEKDENFEECIDFAVKAGYVSEEEAEMAKKTGGKGPGGCRRDECDDYCDKEENFEVCLEWAHDTGMINDEYYEMAKKTGGKGPGDCKGAEECDIYCDTHVRECMDWMIEHDLLSEEDKERLENMDDDMKCMLNCMLDNNLRPGEDCGPGTPGGPVCDQCSEQCFANARRERGLAEGVPEICLDRNYDKDECISYCENNPIDCGRDLRNADYGEGPELDDEHRCMAECMIESNLIPGQDCQEGTTDPDCLSCGDKCFEIQETYVDTTENNDLSGDERCIAECMVDAGLTPGEECPTPDCGGCIDRCIEKPQEPEPTQADGGEVVDSGSEGSEDPGEVVGDDTGVTETTDNTVSEDSGGEEDSTAENPGVTGEIIRDSKKSGLLNKLIDFILNLF
jgi:hypothetical protein